MKKTSKPTYITLVSTTHGSLKLTPTQIKTLYYVKQFDDGATFDQLRRVIVKGGVSVASLNTLVARKLVKREFGPKFVITAKGCDFYRIALQRGIYDMENVL